MYLKIISSVIFQVFYSGFAASQRSVVLDVGINGAKEMVMLYENSYISISATNINSSVAKLIFEVHTQADYLTLSQSLKPISNNSISGKNIGMVSLLNTDERGVDMWLHNFNSKNVSAFLKIIALDSYDPVPGGCNMEFPTSIAPYLRLKSDNSSTFLEYQHANIGSPRSTPQPLCSSSIIYLTYDIYILFLKENDYSEKEYVDKIENMTNINFIKEYATKVQSRALHPDTRSVFFKYPNVGVIYNVVAKYTINGAVLEAAYVPVAMYGCDFSTQNGCRPSDFIESKVFLFILSILGFVIAFFGHKFFVVETFFFGFLIFMFIGFILLAKYCNFDKQTNLEIAAGIGIFGGIFWAFIWVTFSTPVISLLPVGFAFGFLISATVLYTPLGNGDVFINDKNYWLILCTGMLLITVILLTFPNLLSILASSVVGSYALLLFYDDFLETRLAYIILNVVKRAVSKTIHIASNEYPFQAKDIVMSVLWVLVSLLAIIIQLKRHSSKASFCLYCKNKSTNDNMQQCSRNYLTEISIDSEENLQQPLLRESRSESYQTFYR